MSEPLPEDPGERLNDALVAFTACIDGALDDICSVGLTIGETYVPFNPDEDDEDCDTDDVMCSQVWVRVTGVQPTANGVDGWDGDCGLELSIGLEVGVLRCLDIPEGGEAPSASDVLVASMQAMTDMKKIMCAALACEVWDALDVGSWSPLGPLGGQYGGTWTFTAALG